MRVICANQAPDHTTIARFRQRHERALAELFGEVLALCAEAGLVRVGVIAVDGTKVQANASQQATRDYEQIAREILEEADAVDAAEDERFGERARRRAAAGAGDRAGPARLAARGQAPARERRAEEARPIPRIAARAARRPSAAWRRSRSSAAPTPPTRPTERAGVMKDGRRFGRPPKPYQPPRDAGRARSTSPISTRATSRPRAAGCRATTPRPSCTEDQIVIAAEVNVDSPDFGHLEPMVDAAQRRARARPGSTQPPEVVLADAGYWHQAQMERLVGRRHRRC